MQLQARHNLGILYLIAANAQTAVVDAVAKYLSADMHPIQVVWGYFLAIAVLLAAYAVGARIPLRLLLTTRQLPLQLTRSGLLVGAIAMLFIGLAYIPLADAIAITFMAPLFITMLAGPLLGERVGVHRFAAVVAGLAGIVIIIQPGSGLANWAVLMPLLSALSFAFFQIATRRLAATAPTMVTLYYTGFGGLAWISLFVWPFWTPLTLADGAVFLAIGGLGVGAHVCIIKAFEAAQASLLAPFNYAKLVWGVILGYAVFGDIPGAPVITGSAVIIASGLYVFWREGRRRR